LSSFSKKLYLIKRFGNSIFTYDCASCGKPVQGKCLCEKCSKELSPSGNYYNGFACAYYYKGPAKYAMLRYKFSADYKFCFDTLLDWLLVAYEKLGKNNFDAVKIKAYFRSRMAKDNRFRSELQKLKGEKLEIERIENLSVQTKKFIELLNSDQVEFFEYYHHLSF
jgi:predicted amidophosphoribosyltransferase